MSAKVSSAILQSAIPEWTQILTLIFGGCCSNVWALEAILKDHPGSGTFLTFSQFVFVALQNVANFVEFPWAQEEETKGRTKGDLDKKRRSWLPRLRKRQVPIFRWMGQVVLFLGISLLNNYAFGLKIPMTVHIIFRSGGLCVSMLTAYLVAGRRYTVGQVLSGIMITVGIVLATLSAPSRGGPAADTSDMKSTGFDNHGVQYAAGIAVLSLALVLSAFLGLFQEETYKRYGKAWQEGLFYSHLLSIPFFLPFYPTLTSTYTAYATSAPTNLVSLPLPESIESVASLFVLPIAKTPLHRSRLQLAVPSALLALAVNVITQGMCIRGVNRLTARVSSTTVNLVLTVRKAVSLGISVWFYGSGLTPGLAVGGGMVLLGTVLYSFAAATSTARGPITDPKKTEGANGETASEGSGTDRVSHSTGASVVADKEAAVRSGDLRRRK